MGTLLSQSLRGVIRWPAAGTLRLIILEATMNFEIIKSYILCFSEMIIIQFLRNTFNLIMAL